LAAAAGLPGYEVLQYCHTYLRQFGGRPSWLSPDGEPGAASPELLSYLRASAGSAAGSAGSAAGSPAGSAAGEASGGLTLVAYSPLLSGRYVRSDKPLGPEFDHPGTERRLFALRAVA